MTLKHIAKFTSADGTSIVYTFSKDMYEWQRSQPVRNPHEQAIGADYGYRHAGTGAAPVDVMRHSIRTLVHGTSAQVDTAIADAISKCRRIGEGKLWTVADDETERWQWASLEAVPDMTISALRPGMSPLVFQFVGRSEWHASAATTGTQAISASPQTFTINNPGDLPVYAAVFRFRSGGASGFDDPKLENLDNDHEFQHERTAADADSEVRIDTGRMTAEWSTNDGSSYADDIANFSIGDLQYAWMKLEPGGNSMRASGGTNYTIEWEFDANYAH